MSKRIDYNNDNNIAPADRAVIVPDAAPNSAPATAKSSKMTKGAKALAIILIVIAACSIALLIGNLILNSYSSSRLNYGIIRLKGDLIQKDTNANFIAKNGHRVILNGDGPQTVTFKNSENQFNILELTKTRTNYQFSPARCWVTLVGVDNEWPFIDVAVKEGNWKYEAVKYVYDNMLVKSEDIL